MERNCLDKFMRGPVKKILENYQTSIKSTNLNKAFEKVDQVKAIAGKTITQMSQNME